MKKLLIGVTLIFIAVVMISYKSVITLLRTKTSSYFTQCPHCNSTELIPKKCYKNYFSNYLLVIVYNYPHYDSVSLIQDFYKPVFPNIFFCGPDTNVTHPLVKNMDIRRGIFGYKCLGDAIRHHHGYEGFFYINDDVILNFWNLIDSNFDPHVIWISNNQFGKVDIDKKLRTNWYWWISPYGFTNAKKAVEEIKSLAYSYKAYQSCYETFLANGRTTRYLHNGRSDILYIPRKFSMKFQELSRIFYKYRVFLEIAIPSILQFLDKSSLIKTLQGYYIPGDVRKKDPRVTDSRYFWTIYLNKPELWFIHPFKLHHKYNKNRELNIALMKHLLIAKTNTLAC